MMHKSSAILATVAALSLLPTVAIAEPLPPRLRAVMTEPLFFAQNNNEDRLLDKLNLSSSQKQQIQTVRDNYHSQIETKSAALRQASDTMKSLMANGSSSRSQLENQQSIVSTLRQQLANLHFQQMMDIRDILTTAQREQLAEHMSQRMNKWSGDRRW